MMRLKDKVAIITGGARGIGKAAVIKFCSEGAKVVIWDVLDIDGEKLANEMNEKGFKCKYFHVDVTNYSVVEEVTKKVIDEFGQIDVLINNAGITRDATLLKMTEEQWNSVINVNLTGVFNCTKAVAIYMVEKGKGKIINTSSVVALYGNFGQSNYVATKSGIIGLTKVWARELGRKGICVNAVAPGFIETEMVQTMPEKILQMMKDKTPLGRLGKPEEIASAYLFLASDEADFINGAVLSVDGGITL
ncbi:MAG: 3-oxoacyl-ACP reductase FabG [Ignavibacteria bacterium]|nr:3-oxoacyl-ACP reductase FabG [Ignavibacteria bacterium]